MVLSQCHPGLQAVAFILWEDRVERTRIGAGVQTRAGRWLSEDEWSAHIGGEFVTRCE